MGELQQRQRCRHCCHDCNGGAALAPLSQYWQQCCGHAALQAQLLQRLF
jgi:hypothetical protein